MFTTDPSTKAIAEAPIAAASTQGREATAQRPPSEGACRAMRPSGASGRCKTIRDASVSRPPPPAAFHAATPESTTQNGISPSPRR